MMRSVKPVVKPVTSDKSVVKPRTSVKSAVKPMTSIKSEVFLSVKVFKDVKNRWVMISRDLGVSKLTFGSIVLTSFVS